MASRASDSITKRTRGYLPHWERNDGTYFVTLRLADALPQSVLQELVRRKQVLVAARRSGRKLLPVESVTDQRLSSKKIEAYLDSGAGACWFKCPELAAVVANALKFWDGTRYQLEAWCVMPNHAHVLFWLFGGESLAILGSWKKFTSRRINAMVKRRGMLWQDESYDHLIRNEEEFARAVQYILDNPRKAGWSAWPWVYVRSK
jgi:REP element-mobilizing transposase RayT